MRKISILVALLLLVSVAYSQDHIFTTLSELAMQGKVQESGFYLNSKNCPAQDDLHVAYDPKKDILIFGYFYRATGIIENCTWNRKTGESFTLSCKVDEVVDLKKAKKVSQEQMKDLVLKFRADWIVCK